MDDPANVSAPLHLALIGAGALGCVYGVRLAAAGARVTFVVRPQRLESRTPMLLEQVGGSQPHELREPAMAASVPNDATVMALAVRADNLDERLGALLGAAPPVPVLSLTPLMPAALGRLRALTAQRVVVAMPGVAAYRTDRGVVRYWLPRMAPTLVDDTAAGDGAVRALVEAMRAAGIPARFEARVDALNPATTMRFLPLVLLLDTGGGTVQGALAQPALLDISLAAITECRTVAERLGPEPAWSRVLSRFAGRSSLRVGIGLARRLSPEAVHFVEQHFGSKTHEQNVLLGREVVSLGEEHGVRMEAMQELVQLCERAGNADA
jgi:2-dehydropantoate 2-reductase